MITPHHQQGDDQEINIGNTTELLPQRFGQPGDYRILGGGDFVG